MLTRLVLAVDRHVTGAIWTVAALLLAVLALIGGFQVFTRFVWNQPSPWTEELIGRLFAWCVMLGIVAAFRQARWCRST
jgi:TRAP-type C4-dicarboxylate transport system permease small subunit